jgi:hypothetical protein
MGGRAVKDCSQLQKVGGVERPLFEVGDHVLCGGEIVVVTRVERSYVQLVLRENWDDGIVKVWDVVYINDLIDHQVPWHKPVSPRWQRLEGSYC